MCFVRETNHFFSFQREPSSIERILLVFVMIYVTPPGSQCDPGGVT